MVLPGLTLPLLLSRLGLEPDGTEEQEETEARLRVAEAALARIEALTGEEWVSEDIVEQMRELYEFRRRRFTTWLTDQSEDGYEQRSMIFKRFRRELLVAEREALLQLRNEGHISDEVRRRVERDLDLEEIRFRL
jgi:CPA1 family monovalent cation:H+ antiporter